ncbi:3-phosphoshikimate 1-carboxyvinyltransferase [Bacteroides propionicifaciens]|uniref:3-phosphoshikimate 1-carboxyvinyltransferase n=1 Tax=Bacteroides propionicifaciens TaxID=392838 RepID=UPI00035C3249|nr:3-phosphoshikimate 1-carboxyvinyltransferase [Bacteroides propionicifaciens]
MKYLIEYPKELNAKIQLPASKSISNRALIIYALTQNGILPQNLADCDDTSVMIKALNSADELVDIMAAGTSMRFLTAFYATQAGTKIMTGTERMQNRPIHLLVEALRKLGADIEYLKNEGFPPLKINGKKLQGGDLSLDGSISSQFITALLLIGPTLEKGLNLELKGEIASKPYIDMTLALMNQCGASAKWTSPNKLEVKPQPYKPTPVLVESDWSAASYWFEMVALMDKSEILLKDVTLPSLQGDAQGAELFKLLGVDFKAIDRGLLLTKTDNIADKLDIDFTKIPDLAQTFVVAAALLNIPFRFTGLQTLRIKETDRIAALINELKKLGYNIKDKGDTQMYWNLEKTTPQAKPVIATYEDHRMAMALAPAAIKHPSLIVDEPMVVTKSYPTYWEDLQEIGVKVLKI